MHRWLIFGIALCLLCGTCAFGVADARKQSGVDVRGTVFDESGAVVPLATVILVSTEWIMKTRTGGDGRYEFSGVHSDTYELVVEEVGFRSENIPNIQVSERDLDIVDVTLKLKPSGGPAVYTLVLGGPHLSALNVWYEERGNRLPVQGVVTNALSRLPLSDAEVILEHAGKTRVIKSNSYGRFYFLKLDALQYNLTASRGGYNSVTGHAWVARRTVTNIEIAMIPGHRSR